MKVYHGSYCSVDKPSVLFSRDALDFGKGFYKLNNQICIVNQKIIDNYLEYCGTCEV
ncbi:MAG: DUF3990 domain-containing protein [Sarcina sp.]